MKLFFKIIVNLCVGFVGFSKNLFLIFLSFCKRVIKSAKMMSGFEKRLAITFFIIALALFGVKAKKDYIEKTKIVPGNGGVYKEAVVGEFKYFSPILVSSDVEKSTSKLIFSGLVKFDKSNNVSSDLAEKWDVSADGLKYNFYLKDNVYFHDGQKLTAADVVYTIEKIKDPVLKSPLYGAWADVDVSFSADNVVTFDLPRAYGPFIYNCDFGVLPAYLSEDQFSKKVTGTGPYEFKDSKTKDGKITKIDLEKYGRYFGGSPHLNKIELDFFKDGVEAKNTFLSDKTYTAISGAKVEGENITNLNFDSTKQLGLILNLRNDRLKDKTFRQLILGMEKSPDTINITLSALDNGIKRDKAEELKKQLADRNIILDIKYYSSVELQDVLDKRDFELLLYGFDFGHDRDPYIFWHSSQVDNFNFSGYSDKNSDILLEDARMITDYTQRNAKYDQFYGIIKSEALAVFYDPIKVDFSYRAPLRGVAINCNDIDYRYDSIKDWYLKIKRVSKTQG